MEHCRTILAATDLSPRANRAARRAAQLAHVHGSTLHLVLVLSEAWAHELPQSATPKAIAEDVQRRWVDGPRADLRELAEVLHRHYGVRIQQHVLFGRPHEVLVSTSQDVGADLVVVGAHGAGFFRDLLLGSTAFYLLRHSRIPVLVVKNDVHGEYENVLVGIDFSPEARRALSTALMMAPHAEVTALNAVQLPFECRWRLTAIAEAERERYRRQLIDAAREELTAFLADVPAATHVRLIVEYGNAPQVIFQQAWQQHADLVVIAKHGRGSARGVEPGRVSRRVIDTTECDVLLVAIGE